MALLAEKMPGVGALAPDFSLSATPDGEPLALSSFRGRRHVLLAFFPMAFSPG